MFNQAYVRGIQTGLVNADRASFPNEETAYKVADFIAERITLDFSNPIPAQTNLKIAQELIAASDYIKGQPGFKAASFNKLATWDDVQKLAEYNAEQLMVKAAEGSTIEGADKGNTETQSTTGEAKMDVSQRPPGYAEDSRGKTEVDTRPGAKGVEEPHPKTQANSPAGDNSVVEQSRTASLHDLFRKAAEGSTILGGDHGNKAMSSGEAKMDADQRPSGYAVLPGQGALGELMTHMSGPAMIGKEMPHPNTQAESPSGSNSVIQTAAKAASEDPYITLFKKTAAEVNEFFPHSLSENEKIAAVRACMGMTTKEKAHYLQGLQKEASQKLAAANGQPATVPPGSRTDGYTKHSPEATHSRPGAYDGRGQSQGMKAAEDEKLPFFMQKKDEDKKDGDKDEDKAESKSEEKKEEPKDEDKKEASLKDYFRRITDAQRA